LDLYNSSVCRIKWGSFQTQVEGVPLQHSPNICSVVAYQLFTSPFPSVLRSPPCPLCLPSRVHPTDRRPRPPQLERAGETQDQASPTGSPRSWILDPGWVGGCPPGTPPRIFKKDQNLVERDRQYLIADHSCFGFKSHRLEAPQPWVDRQPPSTPTPPPPWFKGEPGRDIAPRPPPSPGRDDPAAMLRRPARRRGFAAG